MTAPPFPAAAIAAARDSAKAHLRVENDGEDATIATHAESALALAEAFLGCALIIREWRASIAGDGCWRRLAMAPVVAITAPDGVTIDIDASGDGWARTPGSARVAVTYAAGLAGEWDLLPAAIRQGVVLLTAHLFNGRPDGAALPASVAALWRPYRRIRLEAQRGSGTWRLQSRGLRANWARCWG
jgi:hypothetical protein